MSFAYRVSTYLLFTLLFFFFFSSRRRHTRCSRDWSSDVCSSDLWRQGMMGGAKAHYDGIVAFSQTDFTEDLKKITVPVLVMHGDDDQIVPYADSAPLSAKLLRNSTLKTYKGFPHGMPTTEADTINADLLAFLKGAATTAAA